MLLLQHAQLIASPVESINTPPRAWTNSSKSDTGLPWHTSSPLSEDRRSSTAVSLVSLEGVVPSA